MVLGVTIKSPKEPKELSTFLGILMENGTFLMGRSRDVPTYRDPDPLWSKDLMGNTGSLGGLWWSPNRALQTMDLGSSIGRR